jgi:hypothetical protein
LTAIGAQNTIVLDIPRQSGGISLGISSLMRIVGASIGPALAEMYLQSYQYKVGNITRNAQQFFPNAEAYDLIFLTAASIYFVSDIEVECSSQMPKPVTRRKRRDEYTNK